METQASPHEASFVATFAGLVIEEPTALQVEDLFSGQRYPIGPDSRAEAGSPGDVVTYQLAGDSASIVTHLAAAGSAKASIYAIAAKFRCNPYFAPAVQSEAAAIAATSGNDDPALLDYADKAFCTIDGPNTRDLDQALYIETAAAGFKVFYALADASYYVKPGTALFNEALARGTSFYLPDLMIPMLPRELCEGVISLNPGVQRRALVFELTLDSTGQHTGTTVNRARIVSRAQLSFDQVQAFLDEPRQHAIGDPALESSLTLLKTVGLLRIRLADERNVVRYRRAEIDVSIDGDGLVFNLLTNVSNDVELYNEQLSLLCNTAGAQLLAQGDSESDGIQPIYKVHPEPPADKLRSFEAVLQTLVLLHHLDPARWLWDQRNPLALADYLKQLPSSGPQARIAKAIQRQALMTNTRSLFSAQADRHYGVGADVYARFSAPMREIAGIFLHKELLEKCSLQAASAAKQQDDSLRVQIIAVANRAQDTQKQMTNEANRLAMNQIFNGDLRLPCEQRPARAGTLIGLAPEKLYVLLDDPGIEIKIYLQPLAVLWQTRLTIDSAQAALYRNGEEQPVLCLGDTVTVLVADQGLAPDRWVFQIHKN